MVSWRELYDDACTRFGGQTPSRSTEAALVEAFESRPATVQRAVAKLGDRYAARKVHTPWPLVLAELDQDAKRADIVADPDADPGRERQIHLAERYIANAGCFLPTEAELLDELFGYHGRLKAWADDEPLRRRMVDAWQAARPAAERTEREQLERAHRWRHGRPGERPDEPPPIPW
jgi:hypothetical protein